MKDVQMNVPTGYAPTNLPFFSQMNDIEFEEFCTALLNLHPVILCERNGKVVERRIIRATKLLSGTSQRGVDIRAEAEEGEVWFFQCKRLQNFGPKDVSDAVDLAEKGFPHADQFVLVITSGLSDAALRNIAGRPKWDRWDAARLTSETIKLRPREEAINLVHRFFGPEWRKALFSCGDQLLQTWQNFFARDLGANGHQFNHCVPFVPWGDALRQLEAFADSGSGRALVLSAGGGQGKSRLLLELAQSLEKKVGAPRVCFLNLNRQGLEPAQSEFIAREEGDLLLVVDDAHRLSAAIEDIAKATESAKSIRLLFATRPQALEAVRSQLYRCGYAERLDKPITLPRWRAQDIHTLAERVLTPQHHPQAALLARLADRCPLLVVLGGALINANELPVMMTDGEAFRERVFRSFKEDFLNRQPEPSRERLDRLIRFLSFVSPTPKNETLWNKAAEILGCSALDVAEDLESLQAAGMVVENREGVRLYPDLFADAVLLDASLDLAGRASPLCRTILQKIPISDFPTLMRNLAQADWEARTKKGEKSSLFDPIWKEFVRRFDDGIWVDTTSFEDFSKWILEPYVGGSLKEDNPTPRHPDRFELLDQWAAFAIFLPERTLELANLTIRSTRASSTHQHSVTSVNSNVRARICRELPALLKPIVIWHSPHANQALDILWTLDDLHPEDDSSGGSNAINVIAEAVSFEIHKPIAVTEKVLGWLEHKTHEPATLERVRHQPWILSAVLKPIFGREVENAWSIGKSIHITELRLAAEKTRPLRQKALAMLAWFLCSGDVLLIKAVVPVIEEAIRPIRGQFGSPASKSDQEAWRVDRLEAASLIERAIVAHQHSAIILAQLRRILRDQPEHEPDEEVRRERQRVLALVPDSFELRVARVLTSWAHEEIRVKSGPNFEMTEADVKAAADEWSLFCQNVAKEITSRFPTAKDLCDFARSQVRALSEAGFVVQGNVIVSNVAAISPTWCASLLRELLSSKDAEFDPFLWPIFQQAAAVAPEAFRKALEFLPDYGRSRQVQALVNFLGWKHLHGGGLTPFERIIILSLAKRPEDGVIQEIASVAGLHFSNEPNWAAKVLSSLKAVNKQVANAILEALSRLVDKHASELDAALVAQCLANLGDFDDEHRQIQTLAEKFPIQLYEHLRNNLDQTAEVMAAKRFHFINIGGFQFGRFTDSDYLAREIDRQWRKALAGGPDAAERLVLVRSLVWSDSTSAPDRLKRFVVESRSGNELEVAARLAAVQGSRFVLQFPDLVRSLLTRANELHVADAIRETLWLSACGGARSFSAGEIDPEYRYIFEQANGLSNRYRDDLILGRFYRMIADYETKTIEQYRATYRREAEEE
jgi:hypothetical protein